MEACCELSFFSALIVSPETDSRAEKAVVMFEGRYSLGGPLDSPFQAVARRGCGTGWEGDLPDVPLALGGAVAGRKPEWGEGLGYALSPESCQRGSWLRDAHP